MTAVLEAIETKIIPDGDLNLIGAEAKSLAGKAATLLPVEEHTRVAITKRMEELRLEADRLGFYAEAGLPMIPTEVLTWRQNYHLSHNYTGRVRNIELALPKLALVSVDAQRPQFGFGSGDFRGDRCRIIGPVPSDLIPLYNDCLVSLTSANHRADKLISAYFTYTGAIPDSTREKIAEVREAGHFRSGGMFLLCEADVWTVEAKTVPRVVDPIVVGFKHEALWMIDVFDPTPVEQYIALEFSSAPALTEGAPA